ncbi:MAG TPA: hypothetical protein VK960_01580 [Acidimicrobiia bacterium]|nr:hypothetical protein [Acidimicrobiia bacterium]
MTRFTRRSCAASVAGVRFRLTSVLGKALATARAVLDDLDSDQVPASLRPIVAHAGELTPPLAEKLLREIDRFDWLRERALESWGDGDPNADGPHRASALFLARPDGWVRDLIETIWEAGAAAGSDASERESRAVRALETDIAAAREKVKNLQKEVDGLKSELAAERKTARAPDRERRVTEARALEAQRQAEQERAAAVAEVEARVAGLEGEMARLREELRVARRDRATAEARAEELRAGGRWSGREPLELARHLDDLMAQARHEGATHDGEAVQVEQLALPIGVSPDTAEAIDAVVRLQGPIGIVVDGYNAGLAMGEGALGDVRARLEDVLRRLGTLGGPAVTVTVVWDSRVEESTPRRPDGLDVRFAPPGTPADDVVVALAATAARCVVITNDREVRERSEAAGALTLWSDALVAWARRR